MQAVKLNGPSYRGKQISKAKFQIKGFNESQVLINPSNRCISMQKCRDLVVNLSNRGFSFIQGPFNQVSVYLKKPYIVNNYVLLLFYKKL